MSDSDAKVVGVLVAYNTDGEVIVRTARRLAPQMLRLLVMDNSDLDHEQVSKSLAAAGIENVEHISCGGNVGIASAQNQGIARAVQLGAEYVLFLDDDSSFPEHGVNGLVHRLKEEGKLYPETAGVGPEIVDHRTGQALVAVWEGSRVRPGKVSQATEVAYLVSSGALIDVEAFEKFGLFKGDYFIDHVDKEWGLRVGLNGGRLVVTSDVTMVHQLGDTPTRTRSGSVRYTHGSATRDYYLTRNAVLLMRDLNLPAAKYVDLVRLLGESSLRKIFGRGRTTAQRRAVLLGLGDGIRNRRGPRPS